MARLPDRFDLWVRKARESRDPARQIDYVLGALIGLEAWHFLNIGTQETPAPAEAEIGGERQLLVFTDVGRIQEILEEGGRRGGPLPVITIPSAAAMVWCMDRQKEGCAGLLVNPGEDAVLIPMPQVAAFHADWAQQGGALSCGFWIPNLTSEEEDFWQEHGL